MGQQSAINTRSCCLGACLARSFETHHPPPVRSHPCPIPSAPPMSSAGPPTMLTRFEALQSAALEAAGRNRASEWRQHTYMQITDCVDGVMQRLYPGSTCDLEGSLQAGTALRRCDADIGAPLRLHDPCMAPHPLGPPCSPLPPSPGPSPPPPPSLAPLALAAMGKGPTGKRPAPPTRPRAPPNCARSCTASCTCLAQSSATRAPSRSRGGIAWPSWRP